MEKIGNKKDAKHSSARNYKSSKMQKKIGYYIPIIFIIAIIPLITFGKITEISLEQANFWKGGTTQIDFFSYYKYMFLLAGTFAALCTYGGLFLDNKLPLQNEKRYYIPMLIYALFVIVSTILSNNKETALYGFIELYQGMFVLLCYILLTFILMNYIRDEKDIKVVVYSFAAITIAEGLLGLTQYFGHDFFQTSLGQLLISPAQLKGNELKFTFGPYTIYGTLYNTNFVGSFAALVLPITTALYLFAKDKKQSIVFGIIALLAFITWIGCNSRAGYLGVSVAAIIGIVVFRKVIKENYKKVALLLVGFAVVFIIFNSASNGKVTNQVSRLMPTTEQKKIIQVNSSVPVRFNEVSIKDNSFTIKTNKETLICIAEGNKIAFNDENGKSLELKNENGNISFKDEKYAGYNFALSQDKPSQMKANIYGRDWDLYIDEDGFKVISSNNKLTLPVEAARVAAFDGNETFASNRGYIWSRTIPMMKDTFLIGYGPDNYALAFPQEDYVGRFNVGSTGMTNIIVDKPHNLYMQTAINTGGISLLALIAIWVIYLLDSFKLYLNGNMSSFVEFMGAASFLSITAYLTAGMFNDSVISVAPLFWIMLGLGIGINKLLKDRKSV